MNLDIIPNFIKTWHYPIESNTCRYTKVTSLISPIIQMLITSDGSLTRHNAIISSTSIQLEIIREVYSITKKSKLYYNKTQHSRLIWLSDNQHKKIFACSYWEILQHSGNNINITKSIGQELIKNEINIHRDLLSIYYGYCNHIEKQFNHKGPLWGRSYRINTNDLSPIIIHEVFVPTMIKTIF